MKTMQIPTKLTLTVKRPNGQIEDVIHPTLKSIDKVQFAQIQADTAAAGRGEVLTYKIDYKSHKMLTTMSDILEAGVDTTVVDAMALNGHGETPYGFDTTPEFDTTPAVYEP